MQRGDPVDDGRVQSGVWTDPRLVSFRRPLIGVFKDLDAAGRGHSPAADLEGGAALWLQERLLQWTDHVDGQSVVTQRLDEAGLIDDWYAAIVRRGRVHVISFMFQLDRRRAWGCRAAAMPKPRKAAMATKMRKVVATG